MKNLSVNIKMKKAPFFLLMIFILFLSNFLMGQLDNSYGVKGGLTSAWQSEFIYDHDHSGGFDNRNGIFLAVYSNWIEKSFFNISSEISFSQKGRDLKIIFTTTEFPDGTGEYILNELKLNYFSFALYPSIFVKLNKLKIYGFVGPRIDIEVSRSTKTEGTEPLISQLSSYYNSKLDEYGRVQIGGVFGIGVQIFDLLPIPLGLEFRYNPDITKVFNRDNYYGRNYSMDFLITVEF